MPQEHYVLKCFSCETFQAHIVKKTKKWECKICGAKQSLKRNYGKGSGKDCRNQVMKLNELRLKNECSFNQTETVTSDDESTVQELETQSDPNKQFTSKWEKYLDNPVTDPESGVGDNATDFFVEVEDKKKTRVIKTPENYKKKNKKVCLESSTSETSPSVMSYLFSPPITEKNFATFKNEEKAMQKDISAQPKNKLKLGKYAKYMDDDDDDDGDDDNDDDGGDVKMQK